MRIAYMQQRYSMEITTKRRMVTNNLDESSKRIVNTVFVSLQKFALLIGVFTIALLAAEAPGEVFAEESADTLQVENTNPNASFEYVFSKLVEYKLASGVNSADANLFAGELIARLRHVRLNPVKQESVKGVTTSVTQEDPRVIAIERFFASKGNLPAGEYAQYFVDTSEKYGLDPALLPSIVYLESTGFKHECKNTGPGGSNGNGLGWGGCKIRFSSYEEAIDTVGYNLAGLNPNTKSYYGSHRTFKEKMYAYNSVNNKYFSNLTATMNKIKSLEPVTLAQNS